MSLSYMCFACVQGLFIPQAISVKRVKSLCIACLQLYSTEKIKVRVKSVTSCSPAAHRTLCVTGSLQEIDWDLELIGGAWPALLSLVSLRLAGWIRTTSTYLFPSKEVISRTRPGSSIGFYFP